MLINLVKLFLIFFKIGLFTFGGGYAMIPMITQDMITYGYLTNAEITEFIGIAESTPGPFAINMATFAGFHVEGLLGALVSTLAVVLPSFIIILLIAYFSKKFIDKPIVKNALEYLKPIIVGLVGSAFLNVLLQGLLGSTMNDIINNSNLKLIFDFRALFIFITVLASAYFFRRKITPVKLVLLSALLGIIVYAL